MHIKDLNGFNSQSPLWIFVKDTSPNEKAINLDMLNCLKAIQKYL